MKKDAPGEEEREVLSLRKSQMCFKPIRLKKVYEENSEDCLLLLAMRSKKM